MDRALAQGGQKLHDIAMDRITDGVPSPVFYQGQQVGERRLFSNTLLVQMIKHHNGGYANSPVGHRSRAAQERHAAENCPTCRERRAEEEAAEAARPDLEAQMLDAADELLRRYALKIVAERRHRLAGEVVAADFTLRQMTVLEILMEGCGMDKFLAAAWGDGLADIIDVPPSDFTRELDAVKRAAWAKACQPLRPWLRLEADASLNASVRGGPTIMDRHKVRDDAQTRIAAAQAEWEAAGSEAAWKAWCERGKA